MRIRVCRKEAKETKYWFELVLHNNPDFIKEIEPLITEATEFTKIFSSMINRSL